MSKVFIGVPCGTRQLDNEFFESICNLVATSKHQCFVCIKDRTIVHRARNWLATAFLQSDFDYFLQVDNDSIWPWGNIEEMLRIAPGYPASLASVHSLDRLVSYDLPIVGGYYLDRSGLGVGMASSLIASGYQADMVRSMVKNSKFNLPTGKDSLLAMEWVATGFLLIKREVLQKFIQEEPVITVGSNLKYEEVDLKSRLLSDTPLRFFEDKSKGTEDDAAWSEDIAFCRRALRLGYQPMLDPYVHGAHIGKTAWHVVNSGSKKQIS